MIQMRWLIANWKMELSISRSIELAREARAFVENRDRRGRSVELVLCPSFPALPQVAEVIRESSIRVGSQDVAWERRGEFTGEVSSEDLKTLGVRYVIVGHSERRNKLGETDEMVKAKVGHVMSMGLTPILCVGETLHERNAGKAEERVEAQLRSATSELRLSPRNVLLIAYEPVWAIWPGTPCTREEAWTMTIFIKRTLASILTSTPPAAQCSVLYGGSVSPENVTSYLSPDVHGVLVGNKSTHEDSLHRLWETLTK